MNSQQNMHDSLLALNIDPETFTWAELGICRGMPTNWFFDDYENNDSIARQIDQTCLKCPVIKECFNRGTSNKEYGVWAGIYLTNGQPDKTKNKHKTEQVAIDLASRIHE